MFRQSIDPKGAFPPKSSKKPVKKKKKKPIKRRKRTRDRFGAERRAEQVFKFGEVRSGLSGRRIFNENTIAKGGQIYRPPPPQQQSNFSPADYLRIHQSAIKNQLRDQAEKKATGGTFTGTSLEEEKRVKEAQEVDRLLKIEDAKTRRRFVGALESLVEKVGGGVAQKPKEDVIQLPDKGGTFEIEDRRKPEDDIKFLERSKRTPEPAKTEARPRPSLTNPSKTSSIPTQDKIDERPKQKPPPIPKKQPTLEPIDDPIAEEEQDITPIKGKSVKEKIQSIEQDEIFFTPPPPTEPEPEPEPLPQPEPEPKKLTPEEIAKLSRQTIKEAEEDLAQDTSTDDDAPDIDDTTTEEEEQVQPSPDPTRIQARLENYKALANFSETQKSVPKNFDFQKQHYRLVVLEDIRPEELGRQKTNESFKKGDQFRLQRTDYKGQAIANRGFYFYRDNTGKQQKPTGKNLFKINLANPKVDTKFQEAIKDGKIKIVFDEFEDEI
jgi:hypothetical protein